MAVFFCGLLLGLIAGYFIGIAMCVMVNKENAKKGKTPS